LVLVALPLLAGILVALTLLAGTLSATLLTRLLSTLILLAGISILLVRTLICLVWIVRIVHRNVSSNRPHGSPAAQCSTVSLESPA
jgi:hypothetical protein